MEYGRPPWIALLLAFSFGTYGLAKKQANVEAVESLTFETIVLAPFAFGFLVWLGATGRAHFLGDGVGHVVLLASTGVVTAVPLLCFGAAAIRVPMTTLGLLQYLAPVLQFALGVTVLHEAMTPMRWVGFALVWVALVIFTFEAVRHQPPPAASDRRGVRDLTPPVRGWCCWSGSRPLPWRTGWRTGRPARRTRSRG